MRLLPGTFKYRFDAHYRKPYFEVSGLQPGMGYNVFLIAHNSKGRSNATILQVYTLKDPEKQTGESRNMHGVPTEWSGG